MCLFSASCYSKRKSMREKMVAVPSQRANQRLDQDCALMYKCSISQLAVTIIQINKASVECSGGMSKDADHVGISKNS